MNEKERYRQIVETKGEFNRLFKGQEPVFLKVTTCDDGDDVQVFIYPTGGIRVKQYGHSLFYKPDLRLICRDHIYSRLSSYYHYRYLFCDNEYGMSSIIWYAERNKSEAVVYAPKGYHEYRKCIVDLRHGMFSIACQTVEFLPELRFSGIELTYNRMKAIQEEYQALKKI